MSSLSAIIVFGLLMSVIALIGSITLVLREDTLHLLLPLLVAFASGSLIGGAFFLMIPASIEQMGNSPRVFAWLAVGFSVFLALEQLLQWHHCHRSPASHTRPVSTMLLVADGLHNFIGGMSIGALFISDFHLGLLAWYAAVAHEVPQELGDFGVLVQAGWSVRHALAFNFVSALTFPVGGVIAYALSGNVDVSVLLPFAAGNFLYIAVADLIPEITMSPDPRDKLFHSSSFAFGLGILLLIAVLTG